MRQLRFYLGVCLLFLGSGITLSQNEASKWYFGNYAGLDFMSNPPTVLTNNGLISSYGCASFANGAGNLLFYTNGPNVYTASHTLMANGSGLNGGGAASQPALILKKPGSTTEYFIFNVYTNNSNLNGFYYSIVDMSLSSGQGSVTAKNVAVYSSTVSGKLTGTRHCNGTDYWVLIRDWTPNSTTQNFRAYQVSSAGVNTTAVVSPAATTFTSNNWWGWDYYGCMKISPNGKKLALANYNSWNNWNNNAWHSYELWDFDNSTGAVTNSLALSAWTWTNNNYNYAWGVEFSPDNTRLYGTRLSNWNNNNASVVQWNLCAGSPSAIVASEYTVAVNSCTNNTNCWDYHGTMQLAPNGKIYIANYYVNNNNGAGLSVIGNPNGLGSACNYTFVAQSVSPKLSTYALPNFIGSMFVQPPPVSPFTHTVSNGFGCQGVAFTSPVTPNTTITACSSVGYSLTSLLWNFGDPSSGTANTSTVTNPIHAYTTLGTYTAQLILYYSCGGGIDTIRQVINVNQPCITVNSTSITCANLGSATVQAISGVGPFSYTWMPSNQTSSVATGLSPGSYTITVKDFGNNFTYTAQTIFTSLIPLTGDLYYEGAVKCFGASTATATVNNLAGGSGTVSYFWTDATNIQTTPVASLSAGIWSVTVTDVLTGCTVKEMFMVVQPPAMALNLSSNTPTSCAGTTIALSGINSGGTPGFITPYTYTWSNGPQSDVYTVSQALAGNYTYTLNSRDSLNCLKTNTIGVSFIANPVLTLNPVSICPLEIGTLQVSGATTYQWFDNSTLNTYAASPGATTTYSVIGSAAGCTTAAFSSIIVKPLPVPMFGSNSPRCNGENLQVFALGGQSYYWTGPQNFTSTAQHPLLPGATPAASGQYNFTVTAANSCTASISGTVVVNPTPTLAAAGSTVCVTQTLQLFASSEPGATFKWTGPQTFLSTQEDPERSSLNVNMTGNYHVLAISAQGCSNSAVAHASVTAVPVATFVANSPICDGSDLHFDRSATTGGVNFQWYGPNNFSSNLADPSINGASLLSAGFYTLIVSTGPCITGISKQVIVNPNPVPVITAPHEVCEGKPLQLSVSAPGHQLTQFMWINPGSSSSSQQITINSTTQNQSGVYNATVTDNNGCKGWVGKQVTILENPILTVLGDTVCRNAPAVLLVSGASGYQWYGVNLEVNIGPKAKVSRAENVLPELYTVVGTAVNGCTSIATTSVLTTDLPKPILKVKPNNHVCVNSTLTLEGGGGVAYEWKLPVNIIYRGEKISVLMKGHEMAGEYTLTVTDKEGCTNFTMTTITLDPAPNGILKASQWSACVPFCSDFAFEPYGFSSDVVSTWTMDRKGLNADHFTKCFSREGTYLFTGALKDTVTGCVNTLTYVVNALARPQSAFSWEPEKPVETFDEVRFTNTSVGQAQHKWTWYLEGQEPIKTEHMTRIFPEAGIYRVAYVVENQFGCSDTIVKAIEIAPDFHLYVPDAFTPNADGLNESFRPVGRGISKFTLEVYNRWGERVFLSHNINDGWDGYYNGNLCASQSFVWKAVLTTTHGELKEFTGHVVLVR